MSIKINRERMINARVSKGYNREESVEKLHEVLTEKMSEEVRIVSLMYFGFISQRTAEKWMVQV